MTHAAADLAAPDTAMVTAAAGNLPSALLELMLLLADEQPPTAPWPRVAALVATLLGADFCCVVMRDRGIADRLHVSATSAQGPMSVGQRRALIRSGSVIRRLLDVPTPAEAAPVHEAQPRRHALYVPVLVDTTAAGVVHVRREGPRARPFDEVHASCARLVGTLIGQALHRGRLAGLLRSNYTQLALMGGSEPKAAETAVPLADPHAMALRVARSFYRELRKARFEQRHILAAAGEVIAQVTQDLRQQGGKAAPATA